MIRLKDILKETEEYQQMPNELKKHFLEIISTYGQHREGMTRKSDIRQIAETLGAIADAAQEYTLREAGEWFDRVTIKRNMGELKKLQEKFEKEAVEAKRQEERLEALYEDMGHVLGRYFEIAEISEQQMMERLGIKKINETNNLDLDQYADDFQNYISKKYRGKSILMWKLNVDSMSGAFYWSKGNSSVEVIATPFWNGESKLPVDIQNVDTGDYISQKSYPLKPTGDMKKDEESYFRLLRTILSKVK